MHPGNPEFPINFLVTTWNSVQDRTQSLVVISCWGQVGLCQFTQSVHILPTNTDTSKTWCMYMKHFAMVQRCIPQVYILTVGEPRRYKLCPHEASEPTLQRMNARVPPQRIIFSSICRSNKTIKPNTYLRHMGVYMWKRQYQSDREGEKEGKEERVWIF